MSLSKNICAFDSSRTIHFNMVLKSYVHMLFPDGVNLHKINDIDPMYYNFACFGRISI